MDGLHNFGKKETLLYSYHCEGASFLAIYKYFDNESILRLLQFSFFQKQENFIYML